MHSSQVSLFGPNIFSILFSNTLNLHIRKVPSLSTGRNIDNSDLCLWFSSDLPGDCPEIDDVSPYVIISYHPTSNNLCSIYKAMKQPPRLS